MRLALGNPSALVSGLILFMAASGHGFADDSPPPILPLDSETAPRLIAYPPLAAPLARGVVIIQYRAEHARIMPVFGKEAQEVSPRLGHLHVTVDDWQGTWAHTSEDPIILVGLTPGAHKVLLEVADPTHTVITGAVVNVVVPEIKPMGATQVGEVPVVKP